MREAYRRTKRIFDLGGSGIALVIVWPLMVAVFGLVLVVLGRPVFFRQSRPGLHARPFIMYKFRTMRDKHDVNGNVLPDAERMTSLGKFLRMTSLDELPELFNVLRGEMSLVGPRPLLPEYLPLYTSTQSRRHDVKPGITGWAQVNGRNAVDWPKRFELDVWYVDNCSFFLDLKILALTVLTVFTGKGVTQEGQATMEKFDG